jgi:predicted dehydrogenase
MIRVGVVGYGLAGKVFHAPMITAVEGLELAAVVERSTRHAAEEYPGITIHTSLEAMLEDSSIDLIVIATPTPTHAALAGQVLQAGRHVVVDKPVAIHSSEIASLAALARENGKLLIPYHNRRWDGDFRTLRKLLDGGKLGHVVSVTSTFNRWRPVARHGVWRESDEAGSGILLDLGTHQVDQTLQIFGLPLAISADIAKERENTVSVDFYEIRLRYPDRMAVASGNNLTAIPVPRFTVRGTRGNYIKWGLDPQEDLLRHLPRVIDPGWGMDPAPAWGTIAVDAEGSMITHPVQPFPGDYRLFYAGVRDALLGKSAAPVLPADAWRAARILEWAEQSAAERREIPCDWAGEPE